MDSALLAANELMSQSFSWALLGCFIWGLISIALSPCHLASIPLLMAYVSGQRRLPSWKSAAGYAVLFGLGLFLCIAAIGFICAEFGRLMGDVPATVTMLVGIVISVFGLEMMGAVRLNASIDFPNIRIKGAWGAFVLGCAYGVFSGACTFGFLAPVLACAGLQHHLLQGWSLVLIFALGHCLPIMLAGSFAAVTCRILNSSTIQGLSALGRKCAGGIVFLIGLFFTTISASEFFQ